MTIKPNMWADIIEMKISKVIFLLNIIFIGHVYAQPIISNETAVAQETTASLTWLTDQASTAEISYGLTNAYELGTLLESSSTNVTIDFEDIVVTVDSDLDATDVSSSGYLFDVSSDDSKLVNGELFFNTEPYSYNNSTYFYVSGTFNSGWVYPSVTLTSSSGTLFTLQSMDIGEVVASLAVSEVEITGTLNDGSDVSTTVILDGITDGIGAALDFQTIVFDATWTGLVSVRFQAINSSGAGTLGFDNIKLVEGTVSLTDHSYVLNNLTPDTPYFAQIIAYDNADNVSDPVSLTFTTLFQGSLAAPTISSVIPTPAETSIELSWVTDEPATADISYGLTDEYELGTVPESSNSVTTIDFEEISVPINNDLDANDVSTSGYLFDVSSDVSKLVNGELFFNTEPYSYNNSTYFYVSGTFNNGWTYPSVTLTSSDGTPFTLQSMDIGEVVASLAASEVEITGILNDGSEVSTLIVLDGITDGIGAAVDFETIIFDTSWTGLTSVKFQAINSSGVGVFGLDNIVIAEGSNFTLNHSLLLNGLATDTEYFIQIIASDPQDNFSIPTALTAKTLATGSLIPPIISNATVTPGETAATITWTTNEPSSAIIDFGETLGYELGPIAESTGVTRTIDFEDISGVPQDDDIDLADFTSGGYFFDLSHDHSNFAKGELFFLNQPVSYNGANSIFFFIHNPPFNNGWTYPTVTMSASNGNLFTLKKLDISESTLLAEAFDVEITGEFADGSTLSTVHVLDTILDGNDADGDGVDADDYETLVFDTAWSNLVSVTFQALSGQREAEFALDNIMVVEAAVLSTDHSIVLSNLTVDTAHFARIIAYDIDGNASDPSNLTFTTLATDLFTPPVISNTTIATGETTAIVTWTTDELATSVLDYGITNQYEIGTVDNGSNLTTSHSLNLTGLTSGTTYFVQLTSVDSDGNSTSASDLTFILPTADLTPPTIVSIAPLNQTTVTVVFSENVDPTTAESVFNYAIDNSISVNLATLNADQRTVTLETSLLDFDLQYLLNVVGVEDLETPVANISNDSGVFLLVGVSSDLIAHWNFEEGTGLTTEDVTGNGHQGQLNGSVWDTDTDDNSTASLLFNKSTVDILGGLDAASDGLSLSLRMKAQNFKVGDARLISKATSTSGNAHYWMLSTINTPAGKGLRFRLKTGSTTTTLLTDTVSLLTDTWYHVAATYDGQFMKIFLDGAEVASVAKTGQIAQAPSVPVSIGNQPAGAGNRPFRGLLDDVRLYNRSLDNAEIIALATGLDLLPAQITAITVLNDSTVEVIFNENVEVNSAENIANYSISGGSGTIGVNSATLAVDQRTVTLTMDAIDFDLDYTLAVNGVLDLVNNVTNDSGTFLLPSVNTTVPPVISNTTIATGETTAIVTWTTDKLATSVLDYGITNQYEIGTVDNGSNLTTSHSLNLTGLTPGTTYFVQLTSVDSDGNLSTPEELIFITSNIVDNQPAEFSNVAVEVSDTAATISWITNELTTSQIDYGLTDIYGNMLTNSNSSVTHQLIITDLSPNTTYHYQITSADEEGNPSSTPDLQFNTLGLGEQPVQQQLFGGGLNSPFGSIDPATGLSRIISTSDFQIFGMAYDPLTETLYATGQETATGEYKLVTIESSSGFLAVVGTTSLNSINKPIDGLAFDSRASLLYGMEIDTSGHAQLYTINPATGELNAIGIDTTLTLKESFGLAFDHNTDRLYGVGTTISGIMQLVMIDKSSASHSLIGEAPGVSSADSLAFHAANGVLYSVDNSTGELISINPDNALTTLIGSTGTNPIDGMTSLSWSSNDSSVLLAYDFESVSGNSVTDESGNGNTGILENGAITDLAIDTRYGTVLDIAPPSGNVNLGPVDIEGTELTISLWINANSFAIRDARLFSKAIGTAENDHYYMISTYGSGAKRLRFRLKTTQGGTSTLISNNTLTANQWTHVAVTYDASEMRIYQDGILVGSLAKSGALVTAPSVNTWLGDNPTGGKTFDGLLDELKVYNRALSVNEIQDEINRILNN